ncbi:MAG: DEAD/DEAH box helicase [Saprospiraceae bacterium]|nr:DEAD/DEAH box helicase [Candidatus Vicinibacter affinis]MBK8642246.1 DEAD/DEAH box helicase [Candidatus Vicinibacter affinis]MBK9640543.1 DEAD/DEAH box helicase [Candidatus Vicinibacter affinis]MBP6172984.1 DEAD/DEAH box helicase [Saprospiraceae bacterium]MBP6522357.1 DEAD/DEAH box helicase [Saprospiraceae bacterium]
MTFKEFNFHPLLYQGIEASGYENATPVQELVIPSILANRDLIASAQTGTGKTAAFLLPLINRYIDHKHEHKVSALIIVPTRELAKQISQHIEGFTYFTELSFIAIYGGNDGQNFIAEKKALQMGADIVVCTPGRLIAHMNMDYFDLKGVQCLVLDEADRMLDMGFQDDLTKIINFLPVKRQTLLFSATMPDRIRQLAKKILVDPVEVNIAISKPPEKIIQKAYVVFEEQKLRLVKHLIKNTTCKHILVFCSRKSSVKELTRELSRARFNVAEIHSDLDQKQREQTLSDFTSEKISILVATDILSRGIDIDTIDLVINYDVPHDAEDYVHRIGRTARAEADGIAITIVSKKEQAAFLVIETLLGNPVPKETVPEELGPVPEYKPKDFSNRPPNRKFVPRGRTNNKSRS